MGYKDDQMRRVADALRSANEKTGFFRPVTAEHYADWAEKIMGHFVGRVMDNRLSDDIRMDFEMLKCSDIVIEMDKPAATVSCSFVTPLGVRMMACIGPGDHGG